MDNQEISKREQALIAISKDPHSGLLRVIP